MLILNETTSALYDDTEESVMQSVDNLESDITVLIIAHRLTTFKKCDKIIKVNNGGITDLWDYENMVKSLQV